MAVLVAAVANMLLGMLWWSPKLFGPMWVKLMGWGSKTKEEMDKIKKESSSAYALSAVSSLAIAYALAYKFAVGNIYTIGAAVSAAVLIWVFFVATTSAVDYAYAKRAKNLWAINYGYHLMGMTVMAVILVLWK